MDTAPAGAGGVCWSPDEGPAPVPHPLHSPQGHHCK
jgi:hypothetical protein